MPPCPRPRVPRPRPRVPASPRPRVSASPSRPASPVRVPASPTRPSPRPRPMSPRLRPRPCVSVVRAAPRTPRSDSRVQRSLRFDVIWVGGLARAVSASSKNPLPPNGARASPPGAASHLQGVPRRHGRRRPSFFSLLSLPIFSFFFLLFLLFRSSMCWGRGSIWSILVHFYPFLKFSRFGGAPGDWRATVNKAHLSLRYC